ncbi:LysR family transcriptional regulator [Roseixanthobacter glucoisosaccharinicivorans]|uniref:LysR family transcriptional regulator n=1 Tax=Roseixanthobacter glucoisosaccharinicivorans TaxID=3119923 RepID=UPI00372B9432
MSETAFDLRYLKYAWLVAEYGSFRKAAEALDVSQSTLSRRIHILERRLGISLFERGSAGSRPTLVGERFLRDASVGAMHLQDAVNHMVLTRRGEAGEVRIGLMASLADGFLAELLASYHARYPNIEVKFEEATSRDSAAGILNGKLDAAFIPGDPRLPGCEAKCLWEERIYAVLPERHHLASLSEVSWHDIRHEKFLVTAGGAGPDIEDHLVRELSTPGFRPRILVQRVGRENLLNLVAKGFGITLTTHSTLGVTYPGAAFRPVGGGGEVIRSSVVWSESNRNPALKRLLDLAAQVQRRRVSAVKPIRSGS